LTDGYETSSIAISTVLYELGRSKEIQTKLRNEILSEMPSDEDFNYDKIMDLPYLDQVLNEAMRLHTPLANLTKMCNIATEVDMLDGKKLYFEKDSVIYIPVRNLHLDEAYYEDPLTFKPERFGDDRGGVKAYEKRGMILKLINMNIKFVTMSCFLRCLLAIWSWSEDLRGE
jgi:cytochrome P450 family 6/cytochrome P450 family 28